MKRDFRKKRDAVLPDFSTLYYRVKGFEKKACHCAAEFFNAMSSCKVFSQKGVPLRHDGIRPGAGDWFVTLEEN
jgi:hypothetical protein